MNNKKLILSRERINLILFAILLISLIFLIQGTIIISQTSSIGNLTNVTLEGNNLTHLNVSNSSIVLYMPFDENYNSTFTYDYTNNSNDGTLVGNTIYNTSQGIYGGFYTFDGAGDYINVPAISIPTSITVSAWVYSSNFAQQGMVVAKKPVNAQWELYFEVNPENKLQWRGGAAEDLCKTTSLPSNNRWHHIVATQSGTTCNLYVDGALVNTSTLTAIGNGITSGTNDILISTYDGVNYPFNGNIDEVMIWNTALNSTGVLAIYNNQTSRFHGTGEMLFQGLNFGGNKTINISLQNCQTNMGSSLRGKINNGNWANFSNCNMTNYDASGTGTLTNANLTVGFIGGNGTIANTFYTPLVIGNISFESAQGDATAPNISSILYSPNSTASVDPSANITFTANVTDADGNSVSYVTLQYYNGTTWSNSSMSNNTLSNYTTSIILVSSQQNYTFNIWANDSLGNGNHSTNQTFNSTWDCTWLSTPDIGSTSGWDTNKFIGNISVNNTGDIAYSNNNCSLDFRLTYDLPEGRIYFDNSYLKPSNTYTISAKANRTIEVNASFLSEIKEEAVIITTQEMFSRSNTSKLNTTVTILSSQSGPYLYQKITSSPNEISLTAGNFSLEGYLRNLMGGTTVNATNTAYNATFNWTLPSGFTNVSGNYKINFTNITDSDLHYNNINVSFSSLASMTSGVKTFYLYASGVNISGGAIKDSNNNTILKKEVNITFSCYATSDSVCVTACGSANDPDCTTSSPTSSVSSGGGGAGSAGPLTIIGKSSAEYELVRGREQSFELEIQNQYSGTLENLKISVSGIDKGLIEVFPTEISRIEPGKSEFLTINIIAPAYFTEGSYVLDFSILGELVSLDKTTKPYIGRKRVELFIVDLSREEANKMKSDSLKMIEQMNNTNMSLKEVLVFYSSLEKSFEEVKFSLVKQNYESIKEVYDNAFGSLELIEELYKRIKEAEKRGISVSETKKLLFIGEVAFKRGDYSSSIERLKEAKLTYALETKGEFNLFYAVKNNPLESSGILLGAIFITFSSFFSIKYRLYKRKLKMLTEEEKLLLELMKVVQRETFEKNHLSMEEYGLAMSQYETKLSGVIEDKIKTETKLAHFFKLKGKQRALKQEKEKLYNLVKNLQDDYLNKGKIETRVYENMIRIYSSRIIEIDERLIFIEAKEALRGKLKPVK